MLLVQSVHEVHCEQLPSLCVFRQLTLCISFSYHSCFPVHYRNKTPKEMLFSHCALFPLTFDKIVKKKKQGNCSRQKSNLITFLLKQHLFLFSILPSIKREQLYRYNSLFSLVNAPNIHRNLCDILLT